METQDRHIELDRQTQTKVSQETFSWKGAAITSVWCFQHPGSRCVWRVTGLSATPLSLVTENRVREKGGPDPLCSCAPGYIAMLRGRFVSVLGFDLGLYSSLWVEWDSVAWPFLQKVPWLMLQSHQAHGCASAKPDGNCKIQVGLGTVFPQPEPWDGCLGCVCTRRVGQLEHEDLVTNWKSHSSFSLILSLENRVGGCL